MGAGAIGAAPSEVNLLASNHGGNIMMSVLALQRYLERRTGVYSPWEDLRELGAMHPSHHAFFTRVWGQLEHACVLVSPRWTLAPLFSQILGLVEKRHERFWSLHGKNPHIQSKILVTQGPRTCLCTQAGGQTG